MRINQVVKAIVKELRNNLEAGESYERGTIYLRYKHIETYGADLFDWDNDFWNGIEKDLLKVIIKNEGT